MRMLGRVLTLSCAMLAVGCCGKELGRVAFSAPGTSSSTVSLEAGEVSFWTDIDIEYEGPASLEYKIELAQGGSVVATAMCNPLGKLPVQTGWVETNLGNSHMRRGAGKMTCSAQLPKAGATEVRATLAFGTPPTKLKLTKADLVVKQ